jgi:uncharacterized protein (TIGR03000 family)
MFRPHCSRAAWVAALVLAGTAGQAHAQRIVAASGLTRSPLQFNNGTSGGYVFFQPAYVTVGTGAVLVRPNFPTNLLPNYAPTFAPAFAVPYAAAYPYFDAYAGYGLPASIYDPAAPGGTVDPAAVGALRFDPAAPGRTFDPSAPRIDPLLLPLQPAGTVSVTRYTTPTAPAVTAPLADPSTATFTLNVPEGAYVWVQGQQTRQSGTVREFVSPPLKPGQTYKYDVKVQWTENDKPVEQTLTLDVQAGDRQGATVFGQSKGTNLNVTR